MRVPAHLQAHVLALHAYDVHFADGPGIHIGMPSTTLTFVLPIGEPLDVSFADRPDTRTRSWASLSGVHAAPAAIHHSGHQKGIQLALAPRAARALFGVRAADLAGELADVGDVDPALVDLPSRLAEAPPGHEAELVCRVLTQALARHEMPAARAEVGRALAMLTRGSHVASVAEEVGYSRRRLSTLVRAEVGVTPQELRRLGRFERSHSLLARRARLGSVSVSDVAADCGYADHAHLTREWGRLAGCTPTAWLAKEFPIVQAVFDGSREPELTDPKEEP